MAMAGSRASVGRMKAKCNFLKFGAIFREPAAPSVGATFLEEDRSSRASQMGKHRHNSPTPPVGGSSPSALINAPKQG